MTPALELAREQYLASAGPCACGSWAALEVDLPEQRRPWSPSKLAEELAKAPVLCRDCREPAAAVSLTAAGRGGLRPFTEETPAVQGATTEGRHPYPGAAAVTAYLSALAPTSQRGMRDGLVILSRMLGQEKPEAVAWHRLGYAQTAALQVELLASGRAPDYCKKIWASLRGVLKASVQLELLTEEQCNRALKLPKIRGSRIRKTQQIEDGAIEKLLAATRADGKSMRAMRDRAMIALLAGGGLRRAEASYVTTDHFDRATGLLIVRGKGDKERPLPLPEWAARAITEFVDARGFPGPILCPVTQRGEALRERLSGGQATYVVARRLWKRAGLKAVGCHAFRRSFCQRVLDAGADMYQAQQLLGHSDPATTANYARRTVEKLAVATARLPDPEGRS